MRPKPRGGRPVPVRVETSEVLIYLRPETDARAFAADLGIALGYSLKSAPHAHVFAASTPHAAKEALERAKSDPRVARAFLNERTQRVHCAFVPNDPLIPDGAPAPFHGQWHLGNGASTSHARLAGAWNRDLTGTGVVIGIVDDSLETAHPDLAPNFVAADSWNFGNNSPDPNADTNFDGTADEDRHGTSVSGVAAARGGNGLGTTGAAPLAGLAGLRISFPNQTTAMFVDATVFHSSGGNTNIKIKNHSYGATSPFIAASAEAQAVADSTAAGTIHLFAAGNERGTEAQDANKTEPQNNPNVIAVAAVASDGRFSFYSSFGANVFVTAPSSGVTGFGILTTDRTGARGYNPNVTLPIPPPPQQDPDDFDTFPDTGYTSRFGGTSSATPLAAGILALGKQAKPALDVRLAKHALTRSSFLVDPTDNTTTGGGDGATAGSAWKTNAAGVKFNQNYGFGRIDADRFVHQLLQMDSVTASATESVGPTVVGAAIPDNNATGVTRNFTLTSTARLEEILVTLAITHTYRGDLQAHLTSPSGTTRRLFSTHNLDGVNNINWTFLSNEFWGEIPAGTWTLRVADVLAVDTGTWTSYSVAARTGTVNDSVAPVVESIVAAAANPTTAASVPFTVTFSEPVSGVNAADFALIVGGGVSGASITGVAGGPWIYTVTVNTGSGDGTIRLDVVDDDSIQDLAGNRLGGTGAGNGSFTAGDVYTIDRTAPVVFGVSSPTADGAYPAAASIPVTVTFVEPVRVTGTPQLRLATGGAGAQVNYASGSDSAALTFTYVVAGGHASSDLDYFSTGALTLNGGTIRDLAGNNAVLTLASPGAAGSLGASKNLQIDTANPGAPGTPAGAPALNNGSFTVSWSAASDVGSGVASYTVRRSDNLGPFNVIATGIAGTSLPQTAMVQGSYRYDVRAVDAAGNIGPFSGTSAAVAVDTSAPPAPSTPDLLLADDTGTSGTDNITNKTTLSFSGTAEAGTTVQIFVDGIGGATTTATGGNWTLSATAAPGLRSITAQATDAAGNPSPVSAALAVSVDVDPPAPPSLPDLATGDDLGTSNSDNLTNLTSLSFSGTAETGAIVQLFVDGAGGATTTATGGAWTLVAPSVAAGTRSITARATDAAGNIGPDSSALPVTIDTTIPGPPSAPDLDPASDTGNSADNLTSLTSLSFSGSAEDGATVQLFIDAAPGPTAVASGGAWTIVATVAAGTRSITARSSDDAGNVSTPSGALSVTVDTTLPDAPSAPDLDPGSDSGNPADNLTNQTSLTFTGTAEAGTTVQLFVGGVAGPTTTAAGGAWSLVAAVGPGVHSITARATDDAGNLGPASTALGVTVDTGAPAPPSTPDLDAASDTGPSNTDNLTGLTSLSFSGTAEDGSTVQVFIDGVGGPAATATGGAWTIVVPVVTPGTRSITARATDAAGNPSLLSGALSVTVDATLPATPSIPDLDAASDTAIPNDNITSATTLSFSGTAEAGVTVRLFAGAVQVGSATAGGGGAWTIVTSPIAAGTFSITATATDTAGNSSAPSAGLSVTIDVDPPAAPPGLPDLEAAGDSGFLNIDNRTNITTLSFSGTAEPGSTVQLFVGGVPGTTVVAAAGTGAWTLTAASLAEGAHLVGARATDVAGNVGPMSGLTQVIIDLTSPAPPSVPDLDPADDHGFSTSDNITNQPNVPLAGTAEPGAFVQIFVDGVAGPTATADVAGTWSFGLVTIGAGTHSVTAQATDVSGNVGPLSAALSITIDASVPPTPSIPDLDPANDSGASSTDNITNLTALTFTGTAEDGTSVQLFVDGVAGPITIAAGGTWTLVAPSVAPGARTFSARATDLAGNVTPPSGNLFVTIDTAAPAAPSTPDLENASDSGASPTDNLTMNTSLSFAGTAEAGATVQLFVDGAPGATTTGGAWNLVASPVAEGAHTITAVATDAAGNVGPPSAGIVVTVDLTAPAPPSVPDLQAASDTGTSSTDNLTRLTSVTFTGTAEAGASVRLFVDGAPGAVTTGGAWSLDATGLADGVRQITAVATDAAGNAGPASAALAVTIDTQAPGVPSTPDLDAASDLGSSSTDNLTSLARLSFSGTADPDISVQLFVDAVGGGTATATGGAWTIGAPGLAPGVRSITARAVDAAGNSSAASAALSVTIDSSTPAAPSVPDLDDASDSGASPTDNLTRLTSLSFSGTAEPGSTVRLFVDGVSAGTATATGGAWTLTVSPVAPGARTITATALDPAGNLSPASGGLVVTVDTAAPAIPAAPVLDAASDTGASSTDRITTLHVLSFTGTAEPNAAIALFVGVTPVGAAAADGSGAFSVTSSFIGDAAHSVTVTATDAAGNASTPSPTLLVIVDNTAPLAGLVQDGLTGDLAVQASATTISAHWSGFDDPLSGILRYEIAVGTTPGGTQISGFADVGTTTSATGGPFALVHGTTYFVTVRATNPVNLQSTATSNGVTVDLQPPAPPGSLLAVPADGGATLYWTASPSGDVAFYRAWAKPASAPWSAATLLDNLSGLSTPVPGLADGVLHDFRLVAVDAAGNESTDLFASATPQPAVRIQGGGTFGTIQAALDAALPGQTVILGPGTFVGDLTVRAGVSLQGWSPQYTVIQGVITVEGTFGSGLSSTVSLLTATGGAVGITAASADLTVRNVVVHHVAGDGISAGAAARLTAVNVTLISNGGDGLQSLGVTIVRNAISGQNGGWGLDVPASATVTYSDAFGNTSGDFSAGGGGTGNFSTAAVFIDAAGLDYRNPAASPTVDLGDPADDFSGEPVPNGGRIDLGAFGNTAWAPLTTMPVVLGGGGGGGGGGGCGLTGLEILVLLAFRRRIRR